MRVMDDQMRPISSQVRDASSERKRASWPRRIFSWLLTAALVSAALLVIALVGALLAHIKPMVVYSGSMEPTFGPGDIILAKSTPAADVREGEIISFSDPSRGGETVTHRLISKQLDGSDWAMVTRGDANTGEERWRVERDGVVGREIGVIPKLGYPVAWLQSRQIAIILIVVCVTLLAAGMLWKIWAPIED